MPITRDEAFPAEAAQLMALLNHCLEGNSIEHVEMAVTNMFGAVVVQGAASRELRGAERQKHISLMMTRALSIVLDNLDRQPSATDVKVEGN